jgi:hypothetical protein
VFPRLIVLLCICTCYSASRPFDKNRSGFVMAEGAGIIIMETEEHALVRLDPLLMLMTHYSLRLRVHLHWTISSDPHTSCVCVLQ